MAVTNPTSVIFCEGKNNSCDYELLNWTILTGTGPAIVPLGDKYRFNAAIEGYFAERVANDIPLPSIIAFRDRDFDIRPMPEPSLSRLRGNKPIFATHRACVENYVLDVELFELGWVQSWGTFPGREQMQVLIDESARSIADYQAVRWALASLKPGDRWPEIRNTWRSSDGDIPQVLDFQSCMVQARELTRHYLEQISSISIERLETEAENFRLEFSQIEFYEQRQYLVWFHGKDLLKVISRNLGGNFSSKTYVSWGVKHLNIQNHPDLLELQIRCNNLG
jgi:hypothetical protein